MPSVSHDQQRMFQGALARKIAGSPRSDDPQMSVGKLQEFTRLARPTSPERAPQRYGSSPVTEET